MKRHLKIFFIVLGVMILCAVLIGLALGSSFEVRESMSVNAPPERVHEVVSGFGPWRNELAEGLKSRDASVEVSLEGPATGVGSTLIWKGDELGEGRVTIVRADPARGVWYEARVRSDEVNVRGSIEYVATEGGTELVTNVDGDLPPVIGGYASAIIEDELHKQLKRALENLKREVE